MKYYTPYNEPKVRHNPHRKSAEMADELGVSMQKFLSMVRLHDGPKPNEKLRQNSSTRAAYYDQVAVKTWWATLKAEGKV